MSLATDNRTDRESVVPNDHVAAPAGDSANARPRTAGAPLPAPGGAPGSPTRNALAGRGCCSAPPC